MQTVSGARRNIGLRATAPNYVALQHRARDMMTVPLEKIPEFQQWVREVRALLAGRIVNLDDLTNYQYSVLWCAHGEQSPSVFVENLFHFKGACDLKIRDI